jgi:cell division septation protein DedD
LGESRFAVQVVSYSQAKFAQQELQQLQRQGEKAFLLKRQGKTTLLVGPFPTKENAASKLSGLRPRYRDCFIRTL